MFCKWCGAELPNSATKCDSCGKDVPAMSECGGFYDLVPGAKNTVVRGAVIPPKAETVAVKETPPKAEPAKGEAPRKPASPSVRKPDLRRLTIPRLLLTGVGFLVVIILLLSISGRLSKSISLLEQVNERMGAVPDAVRQEEAPKSNGEVSAPAQPAIGPLAQQDIRIELSVEDTENGPAVRTSADMGGFYDVVVAHVSYDEDTNSLSAARIDLREAENCIAIGVDSALKKYSHCEGTVAVELTVDEGVFTAADGDAQYEWTYRTDDEAEWTALDERVFMISDDGTKVTYAAEDLAELMEGKEAAEFRLTYRRSNLKGGSLTIVISGITVADETLEEALSENTSDT